MKKVLAFAGSNSKHSINKQLVTYTVSLVKKGNCHIIDLNDYPLPLFSVDLEKEKGFPDVARNFHKLLLEHDAYLISLAEHNASYSAAFKNLFDWISRIDGKAFGNKPMLLMSCSDGGRGGASVMETARSRFPRHAANIVSTFSFPHFYDNFDGKAISDPLLKQQLLYAVHEFELTL